MNGAIERGTLFQRGPFDRQICAEFTQRSPHNAKVNPDAMWSGRQAGRNAFRKAGSLFRLLGSINLLPDPVLLMESSEFAFKSSIFFGIHPTSVMSAS